MEGWIAGCPYRQTETGVLLTAQLADEHTFLDGVVLDPVEELLG
jgi:hypothetical protein